MSAPKVSVVIPCHNAARFVAAAVRSVLDQNRPLEVIVVDDGSSDDSVAVLRRSGLPVTIVEQVNLGVASARNAGIERATGEWVAFIDADDIWLPGKLSAQFGLLAANPTARMAYSAWHVWESVEPEPEPDLVAALELQCATANGRRLSGWIYPELLLDCEVWTSTVVVARSLLQEVGGFDSNLSVGEDYDLWLRLSRLTPILRVERPLALYRMHATNTTRGVPERNFRAEVVGRALARWGYRGPDGRSADRPAVDHALARSWSDYAGAHLLAGNTRRARDGASAALHFDPIHLAAWKVLAKALVVRSSPPAA